MLTPEHFLLIIACITFSGIIIESIYSKIYKKGWYDLDDFFSNIGISSGHLYWGLIITPIILGGYQYIYLSWGYKGLSSILPKWAFLILGYLLTDFIVYWNHRLSHRINYLIAGHITHHSSENFNLSTSIRINWIYRGYSWIIFTVLAFIGYDLKYFLLFQTIINAYNAICHTRFQLPALGVLRYIFVTPTFHQIHHCSNDEYYDKNFGGSLIIWDRIFGTFADKVPKLEYKFGLKSNINSHDISWLNYHYFTEVFNKSGKKATVFLKNIFNVPSGETRNVTKVSKVRRSGVYIFSYSLIVVILFTLGAFLNSYKDFLNWRLSVLSVVVFSLFTLYLPVILNALILFIEKSVIKPFNHILAFFHIEKLSNRGEK